MKALLSLLLLALLAGCGASAQQVALERGIKKATSRSIGCPAEEITIGSYRRGYQAWTARGCSKSYTCVRIDLKAELAECSAHSRVAMP